VAYRRFKINPATPAGEKAEKPLRAAALRYDPGTDGAPRVVASGQRKVAEQILAEARKHHIPIHEDPALATALARVDLGAEIPPELYLVVAEVLAYIYRVSGKAV